MKIYVDADACPVKDIIIDVGLMKKIPVILVSSVSHYSNHESNVEKIYVDNIPQAVDMAILNKMKRGDIVVTQDYGLAAVVIAKHGIAIHHSGKRYTEDNIEELLLKRHIASKIRRSGGKVKGPRSMTKKDKEFFRIALLKIIEDQLHP